jgi:hypothetical protein
VAIVPGGNVQLAIVQLAIVPGGNCPGWQLSQVAIFQVAIFLSPILEVSLTPNLRLVYLERKRLGGDAKRIVGKTLVATLS